MVSSSAVRVVQDVWDVHREGSLGWFQLRLFLHVLKGIRNNGFAQARWEALLGFWDAVCRHCPCGPFCSLHPWDKWVPPDLHGFYKWVFVAMDLLNDFTKSGLWYS